MSKFKKQPVKIGDKVVCLSSSVFGCTMHKPYTVIATHLSGPKNKCQLSAIPTKTEEGDFFIIDDDGDKMRFKIGTNRFGHTWEKLPDGKDKD